MTCDSEKQTMNIEDENQQPEELMYIAERDLLLCAAKQRQISAADWALLTDAELDPLAVNAVLARYRLLSGAELNELDGLLRHLDVADQALFTRMGFIEKFETCTRLMWVIKTYKISHKVSHAVMREAARFALAQAQTGPDFAARYQFYVCCTQKLRLETFAPAIRTARIVLIQDAILLSLHEHLDGLTGFTKPFSPPEIKQRLSELFMQGKRLGFTDEASGLWLTAQYLPLLSMSYAEITRATRDFVRHMQVFFRYHQATDLQLVQTGERWVYEYNYPEAQARLRVSAGGKLTVEFYRLVCTEVLRARLPEEEREFF